MNPLVRSAICLPLALCGCGLLDRFTSYSPDGAESESERLELFFEEAFLTRLDRSPMLQTRLGIRDAYGSWDDISDERARQDASIAEIDLERLRELSLRQLEDEAEISYRLFEAEAERHLEGFRWRFHDYPVNQMHGLHAEAPAFLINMHRVEDTDDARAYVQRLRGVRVLFDQLIEGLEERERRGVLPPDFMFPKVIQDCRNVVTGAPFDETGRDSTLLADFRAKLTALEGVNEATRKKLLVDAETALLESVQPAYEELARLLESQAARASSDAGAWKLPDGDEFYAFALRRATTTDLSADEIHRIGLEEVDRIHAEMRGIMTSTGFTGDLQGFFALLREDERFYYPDDATGRTRYLARATELIEAMEERLDELFLTMPRAELVVKAVEPYRERSAGKAFYNQGSPDGSRPGIYYANLFDMRDMPVYQMDALAYHEGIPGHHMQISIAQEQAGLPRFRRYGSYTAYVEGWALYSELVPKELGFYADPYADFGRLAMELWRACRLVVDTGIHHLRWTRERAIDYLLANTPNPEGDCVKAIERYIVVPGQATAYKIGMLKILELRERARRELDEDFDVREFHEVLLTTGPVPLDILEDVVEDWIED